MGSKSTKLGLLTLGCLGLFIVGSHYFSQDDEVLGLSQQNPPEFYTDQEPILKAIVDQNLKGVQGSYGIVIQELSSSPTPTPQKNLLGFSTTEAKKSHGYDIHGNEQFMSASLYKLVLMAAIFEEIHTGKLTLGDQLISTKQHLTERLGSVDFGYEDSEDTIEYSVNDALIRTAAISDNFAAIMLTDKLFEIEGTGNMHPLEQIAKSLGMMHTFFGQEGITTTPADMAHYFELLYKGEVVNRDSSQKILDLLSKSLLNDRIPAQLPNEVRIAHKTGELPGIKHDAGIVFLEKRPYLIVLMSKDTDEVEAIEVEATISKQVFNYFSNE